MPSAARSTRSAAPRNRSVRPSDSAISTAGPLSARNPNRSSVATVVSPCVGARFVVVGEEPVEVGEQPLPVAVPEHASPGEAGGLVLRAQHLGDLAQPGAVGGGPRRAGCRRAAGAGQHLAHELVEGRVHEAAAVEVRELVGLLGELRDLDPQHLLHEVVVRRARPRLQPRRRHDHVVGGGARDRELREVAVESRERRARAAKRARRARSPTRRRDRRARARAT